MSEENNTVTEQQSRQVDAPVMACLERFLETIRDYERESHNLIGHDERESHDFVKIFIEGNPDANFLLADKHKGMRVSAAGVLGRIAEGWKLDRGMRYMSGEILKHLEEAADRYYSGDPSGVDEFFQLYDLDKKRP